MKPSLVIRGATIIDGRGGAPFVADVAIQGETIVEVGEVTKRGQREIDAAGHLLTPGFVDIHTHLDAQLTWSNRMDPSSWHGVTTVVTGNCGIGIAPLKPGQRDKLVELVAGVEDIPDPVLVNGVPWCWETFPEYLDFIESRDFDVDVVTQLAHGAVRLYVMGDRGSNREPATPADCARMYEIAREALKAGALGISTSRTAAHRTTKGEFEFTLKSEEMELNALMDAMRDADTGWLQLIADFGDELPAEFDMLCRLAKRSGRQVSITIMEDDSKPEEWTDVLGRIAIARRNGQALVGQVTARSISTILGLEAGENPFSGCRSYEAILHLPLSGKVAAMKDPALRARLLSEDVADARVRGRTRNWARLFPLEEAPDYEPSSADSIAARAAKAGVTPEEYAYDYLLSRDGRALILYAKLNYKHGNLDSVQRMLADPNTLVGLGDAGAHLGYLADASVFTYLLSHWTRDRKRGELFSLAWAVRRITSQNAEAIGLHDRGVVAAGYKADLNIIDYARLSLHCPEVRYDLPGGVRRLVQRADGYKATILSGVQVMADGEPTGELPGRLVRGRRATPSQSFTEHPVATT